MPVSVTVTNLFNKAVFVIQCAADVVVDLATLPQRHLTAIYQGWRQSGESRRGAKWLAVEDAVFYYGMPIAFAAGGGCLMLPSGLIAASPGMSLGECLAWCGVFTGVMAPLAACFLAANDMKERQRVPFPRLFARSAATRELANKPN